jgi:cyclophilin family peptidyl-prolyl cis-trans isomerase
MRNFLRHFCARRTAFPATLFSAACAWFACLIAASVADANPFVRLDYNLFTARARGTVFIELFEIDRPLSSANFLQYVNAGKYDNSLMHRMVRDFVLQGGGFYPVEVTEPAPLYVSYNPAAGVDLDGNPATPNPNVNNEFGNTPFRSNVKGTLAMAKVAGNPNSATSEWFFNIKNNAGTSPDGLDFQNGGFTVFAQVVGDGMNLIDAYNAGLSTQNLNPDTNDNGAREGTLFSNVPTLGSSPANFVPLVLLNADRVDYLGNGLTTTVPAGGLAFSTRDTFIDTGATFVGSGELTVAANRTLGIREGNMLAGHSLVNRGTLQPGLQLGNVGVQSFRQDPGASLEIQLSTATADTGYDRLVVGQGALLGGDLDVKLLNSLQPNTSYTILTAGAIVGTFNNINLPQLGLGLVWNYAQTATAVTLTIEAADFDRDGIVSASDYILWKKNRGATGVPIFTRGDGDGDGNVDNDDYALWRRNFGNTRGGAGGGSVEGSVPEPSSVALVLGGLSILACRRGRRR